MSQVFQLTKVIPYFRTKLESLGYAEHLDEYDEDNIANTIIDKTYSVRPGTLSSSRSNSLDFEWTFPIDVTLWFNGYGRPSDAVDGSLESIENFLDVILDQANRFDIAGLREIYPTNIDLSPLSVSNDTIIKAKVGFVVVLHVVHNIDC